MFSTILLLAVGLVQDSWYTFEPSSKDFRVALPSEPSNTNSRSVSGAAGPLQATTAQLKTADGVYSIQVTKGSARVNPKTLDDGVRQFAASKKATLGPLKSVTIGGNPGREFEMTEGQKKSKVRFVASGNALFILSASGTPGAGVPAEADRFLGSLEIGAAKAVAVAVAAPTPKAMPEVTEADTSNAEAARAKAELEKARFKAELEKAKAEVELAKVKAEAELAKVKAEAAIAKARSDAELEKAKAKPKAEFTDTADATVTVTEADKADDDPKDAGKTAAKKSNAPLKVTISRIPKGAKPYADQDLEDVSRSFSRDRESFRDIGPEGSVLVGVRVTYIERFGGPKVRSAQPIYRSGKDYYAGRVYGEVVGPVFTFVARPGYAVGGLVTHTGLTVDGFGMVFMKVDGDHLDSTDTYNSPWIGDRKGGSPGEVTTRGGLIVGLQGRAKNEVNALGLTALK